MRLIRVGECGLDECLESHERRVLHAAWMRFKASFLNFDMQRLAEELNIMDENENWSVGKIEKMLTDNGVKLTAHRRKMFVRALEKFDNNPHDPDSDGQIVKWVIDELFGLKSHSVILRRMGEQLSLLIAGSLIIKSISHYWI